MATDAPLLKANGAPALMSSGAPAVDSGSGCECCGPDNGSCANCSAVVSWTASFSSVDLNTVCELGCYSPDFNKADNATFSGDFTVPITGVSCVWRYTAAYTTDKIQFSDDGSCSPVVNETNQIDILITKGVANTTCQVKLIRTGAGAATILIFQFVIANSLVPCNSPSTNPSDYTAYSAIDCQLGKNGSVTLTPNT